MMRKHKARARENHALMFLRQYLRTPQDVGAFVPSGPQLTEQMIKALALPEGGTVIELGPGTGVFTKALIAAGVAPERLILVERNEDFARHLSESFPGVVIIPGDARELPSLATAQGIPRVDRIVSGLPLRSMDDATRRAIARAIGATLAPWGRLVQFTYLAGPPIPADHAAEAGLIGTRSSMAIRNIPPAFVWQYAKAG
jgi:phosphatidylethanolamine/phosphatidyl-N-methylethanolamine N-methyltransferase